MVAVVGVVVVGAVPAMLVSELMLVLVLVLVGFGGRIVPLES
jgi:hypothetical protein